MDWELLLILPVFLLVFAMVFLRDSMARRRVEKWARRESYILSDVRHATTASVLLFQSARAFLCTVTDGGGRRRRARIVTVGFPLGTVRVEWLEEWVETRRG